MAQERTGGMVVREQFQHLLEDHRGIVLKVAHTYCGHAEDRRDLAQEIAAQAWRGFRGYDPARPFSESALIEWCRAQLERNDVPEIVQVLEAIPKTASQKPIERDAMALLRESGLVAAFESREAAT